jgi:hypothetical protein
MDYFDKRKIDNSRLNAEHLLKHVLGCERVELCLEFGLIQSLQAADVAERLKQSAAAA